MPVVLSSVEVCGHTQVDGVTDSDIAAAAWLIRTQTGFTVDEAVTDRYVPVDAVKKAWSIVAARVHLDVVSSGDDAITSESQGDYSYSVDIGRREQWRSDLLHGLPRELLVLSSASWGTIRPGMSVVGVRDGALWSD